jgi:hypothetical protein
MTRSVTASLLVVLAFAGLAVSQSIKVNPDGVNVNANGATVVFLSFGPLVNRVPAEGCWCGELIPAAPNIGFKCNPATIFGCLPTRSDFSTTGANSVFTDIMSIPPSVARRAYQQAEDGANSSFFYVRRFVGLAGGPDEFVAVTCRMGGGGARTPFSLTDVKLSFKSDKPIVLVKAGERLPQVSAEIAYNGTGRLKGRWETVLPGDELPTLSDLLTEASLPVEQRGLQRRYTQISRFNVFLPPGSKYVLDGPDPSRLPTTVEGPYLILLRIEAVDDKEGDSNLAIVGAGPGVVHSGAVAGFPLPPLRYFVGSGAGSSHSAGLALLFPEEGAVQPSTDPIDLKWSEAPGVTFYKVEVADPEGQPVMSAVLLPGSGNYRLPPWLRERATDGRLRWRVTALDESGKSVFETPWRSLKLK